VGSEMLDETTEGGGLDLHPGGFIHARQRSPFEPENEGGAPRGRASIQARRLGKPAQLPVEGVAGPSGARVAADARRRRERLVDLARLPREQA
jgi:hypothetical protein